MATLVIQRSLWLVIQPPPDIPTPPLLLREPPTISLLHTPIRTYGSFSDLSSIAGSSPMLAPASPRRRSASRSRSLSPAPLYVASPLRDYVAGGDVEDDHVEPSPFDEQGGVDGESGPSRYRRNRDLPEEERIYYSDSDLDSIMTGATTAEAVQAVWGRKSQWLLFLCIGLSSYIYSLDGSTTYQYLYFATSTVLKHSLSGTLTTAQAIIIAVGKPLMAKLSDVFGRAETFLLVTILYVIGYIVLASAQSISQIAVGEIIYAFGYTGLQILQQIVVADMTSLRYRGLVTGLVSAPFIINQFVAAEILERVLPNWRWGYLMFAILVPICLSPLIITLLWAQHKAKRALDRTQAYRPRSVHKRSWYRLISEACVDMDFVGLLLIAASLALFLLPLGLAPMSKQGWGNPTMPALVVMGIILFPVFLLYEWKVPKAPVIPLHWLGRGPILGACLIGFFDFASFYLQGTYLYSFIYVTRSHWNFREITYFTATQMMTMTVFGIIGGFMMVATKRFKYMLFTGLIIRLLGVVLMIEARAESGTTFQLVTCQVLQGVGGGFASIATQVSAQAAVPHVDVATVTAVVLLMTEVGNSVGSALAAGVWATWMPQELKKYVPTTNQTLLDDLFGSIMGITLYPEDDPIRIGAVGAYHAVMYRLVSGAIFLAILPPIFCLVFTRDIKLTHAQNATDNRDLTGLDTGEIADPDAIEDPGNVRLHVGASPARSMIDPAWRQTPARSTRTINESPWRARLRRQRGDDDEEEDEHWGDDEESEAGGLLAPGR